MLTMATQAMAPETTPRASPSRPVDCGRGARKALRKRHGAGVDPVPGGKADVPSNAARGEGAGAGDEADSRRPDEGDPRSAVLEPLTWPWAGA